MHDFENMAQGTGIFFVHGRQSEGCSANVAQINAAIMGGALPVLVIHHETGIETRVLRACENGYPFFDGDWTVTDEGILEYAD